jgi:hypothetical protein
MLNLGCVHARRQLGAVLRYPSLQFAFIGEYVLDCRQDRTLQGLGHNARSVALHCAGDAVAIGAGVTGPSVVWLAAEAAVAKPAKHQAFEPVFIGGPAAVSVRIGVPPRGSRVKHLLRDDRLNEHFSYPFGFRSRPLRRTASVTGTGGAGLLRFNALRLGVRPGAEVGPFLEDVADRSRVPVGARGRNAISNEPPHNIVQAGTLDIPHINCDDYPCLLGVHDKSSR